MLYRYSLITGRSEYLDQARRLTDRIYQYGNKPDINFWYNTVARLNPEKSAGLTYWWVQAYGILFDLYSFHALTKDGYLNDYQKGASFWDSCFVDRIHGDTHFSVLVNGTVKETMKANQFKSSYHTAENGLLNYLYLNAWVNHEPVELYFDVADYQADKEFYANPIEGNDLKIKGITVLKDEQAVPRAGLKYTRIKVVLAGAQTNNKQQKTNHK